ncbi:hypothetical protein V1477_001361 [Vespula maculifrons]|uniref:Uncharacterized protein n=1 Tax=Vespula maculifrons TaxID=7453 RepID=A0ABD2CZB9_VESMC
MSEIRAGKENIKAINHYSKKDLRIHVKDEEEEKGDTGDEEVEDFMIATRIFLLMSWTLSLLTLAVIYNFALHVIRHLMCQIVKGAEVADAAHEFIKKLVNDMEPKLMREAPNYPTYRSKHVATGRALL